MRRILVAAAAVFASASVAALAAQSALAQLGLTEAAAREYVLSDNAHYGLGRGRNASEAPGVVRGVTGVRSVAAYDETSAAVLASGRIMTWGEVRPWTRPDGQRDLSPLPILL